jgi:hypothetical protein
MQFHHQKDFIFRRATGSDRGEVLELVEKSSGPEAKGELAQDFQELLQNEANLFEVALNSNGVLIASLVCAGGEWRVLAANPNFLKKELKAVLLSRVKEWAEANAGGKLALRPKLIIGDWKAFVKSQGAQILHVPSQGEFIQF